MSSIAGQNVYNTNIMPRPDDSDMEDIGPTSSAIKAIVNKNLFLSILESLPETKVTTIITIRLVNRTANENDPLLTKKHKLKALKIA